MVNVVSQRNYTVDLLRAFSILYVVGYWHLLRYIEPGPNYRNDFTWGLTYIILGTFTFISGFLLARRQISLTPKELLNFYQRRLIRVYPIYLLALILFKLARIGSGSGIKASLLLSMFFPPPIMTLWFITMIMFFYLIAPLLIHYADHLLKFSILFCLPMVFFWLFYTFINPLDTRLVMYFPAFALGILFQVQTRFQEFCIRNKTILWISLVPCFLLSLVKLEAAFIDALMLIPLIINGSLLFYTYSSSWNGIPKLKSTVSFLSYISFCMYLFHRLIFHWTIQAFYPESPVMQGLYLLLICLPLTVVISWAIQKAYDWGVSKAQHWLQSV